MLINDDYTIQEIRDALKRELSYKIPMLRTANIFVKQNAYGDFEVKMLFPNFSMGNTFYYTISKYSDIDLEIDNIIDVIQTFLRRNRAGF